MLDRAEHLAAGLRDQRARVLLQGMAERIVGSNEIPGVEALLHQRIGRGVR